MTFSPHEQDMLDRFKTVWEKIPGRIVEASPPEPGPNKWYDAHIQVQTPQGFIDLVADIKTRVFPKDVRDIRWRLQAAAGKATGHDTIPMIMADAISKGAREEMRELGIAYFEASDSLFIPARNMYILVERPRTHSEPKAMTTIFEGQRARVLHAVFHTLSISDPWFNVQDIVKSSGASAGTVSETLGELERRDWVESQGSGPGKRRRLTYASSLLDEWSQYQRLQKPPEMEYYYVPGAKPGDILDSLSHTSMDYEVTGEAAGQKYSPYLTSISQVVTRYAEGPFVEDTLTEMKAKKVSEGWNLGLIRETSTTRPFGFRQNLGGIFYATPLQTYLDLLNGPGRSKDLAIHLRETVLRL